jgi:excisionase family DNA binding protein
MSDLWTVQELADRLKVHPETIRKWIREGAITATRVGRPGTDKPRLRVTDKEARKLED